MKTTAPKRIWINLPYGRDPDDWWFTDMPDVAKGMVAYVQEAEIETLQEALLSSKASLLLCLSSALVGNVPDEKNIKRSIAFIETTLAGKEPKT